MGTVEWQKKRNGRMNNFFVFLNNIFKMLFSAKKKKNTMLDKMFKKSSGNKYFVCICVYKSKETVVTFILKPSADVCGQQVFINVS